MSYNSLDLSILKTIVNNKKHGIEFVQENKPDLFTPELWTFANSVVSYIKTHKELPTLRVLVEKLTNNNMAEHIKSVWAELEKFNYDDKEYKFDLIKIKRRYTDNQISKLKDKLGTIDTGSSVQEIQKTLNSIKALETIKAFEEKDIKDYLATFVDKFNAKKENPKLDVGIKTKYSFLDLATNGFKPADFILVAGESGFGKSLLLQNIAIQTWMQNNTLESTSFSEGKDIIYFSLEMPYEDCFNRLISRLSQVPSRNIENARLSKEEFQKVKKALDFIKNYPNKFKIVDISDACANDIEAILANSGQRFDAVFIDYLGIMRANEKSEESDWLEQGKIAYEVRAIGRRLQLPIFSAVQLNRKGKTKKGEEDDNIGLNRLARSATIATHATHVIQIERRNSEERYIDMVLHLIKNRKGPKGKGILFKDLACQLLIDKPIEESNESFNDIEDIADDVEKLKL